MPATWTYNLDTGGARNKKFFLTQRSSKILNYRVTDFVSPAIVKSWWMLKRAWSDPDSQALVIKEITNTPNGDGQIVQGRNQYLQFLINDTDLDGLSFDAYCIAVKSLFADGSAKVHDKTMTQVFILPPGVNKHRTGLVTSGGSSLISISGACAGHIVGDPAGNALVSFSPSATGKRIVKGNGSTQVKFSPSCSGTVVGEVFGSSTITFSGNGAAKRTAKSAGRSLIQIYSPIQAQGLRKAFGAGSSTISFQTAANAVTSTEPTFPKWAMSFGWTNSGNKPSSTELTDFLALGAPMIRCDIQWSVAEKTLGNYTWGTPTDVLNTMDTHGVKVLFTLDYNNLLYAAGQQDGISTSANRTAFLNFVKAAVTQFKGRAVAWEIWNEPNESKFWGPAPNASDYLALVQAVAPAIKQIDPGAYVINGGISGFDWTYINALLTGGILNYIDGFAVHPYRALYEPETVADDWAVLETLLSANAPAGKTIDLFCSEWGYSTGNNNGFKSPATFEATTTGGIVNKVNYSTALTNPLWSLSNSLITTGIADPVSGNNAFRIAHHGAGQFGISQNGALTVGTPTSLSTYNVSCWIRATSGTVQLKIGLGTGQLGDVFLADTSWKRVSTLINYDGSSTSTKIIRIVTQDPTETGSFELYGPQVETFTLTPSQYLGYQEARTGDYDKRLVLANRSAGVKSSVVYQFKDRSGSSLSAIERQFGLVKSDLTHKAGYTDLQNLVVP